VVLHLHLGENMLDLPFPIDDIGGAHNSHRLSAVEILLLPDPVSAEHLVGSVAGQGKVQPVLVSELLEFLNGIPTHAEYLCAQLVQFFLGVTELVRLAGSTGRVSLGKEEENETVPLEGVQSDLVAGIRR